MRFLPIAHTVGIRPSSAFAFSQPCSRFHVPLGHTRHGSHTLGKGGDLWLPLGYVPWYKEHHASGSQSTGIRSGLACCPPPSPAAPTRQSAPFPSNPEDRLSPAAQSSIGAVDVVVTLQEEGGGRRGDTTLPVLRAS
jgi:hypothetical protein